MPAYSLRVPSWRTEIHSAQDLDLCVFRTFGGRARSILQPQLLDMAHESELDGLGK